MSAIYDENSHKSNEFWGEEVADEWEEETSESDLEYHGYYQDNAICGLKPISFWSIVGVLVFLVIALTGIAIFIFRDKICHTNSVEYLYSSQNKNEWYTLQVTHIGGVHKTKQFHLKMNQKIDWKDLEGKLAMKDLAKGEIKWTRLGLDTLKVAGNNTPIFPKYQAISENSQDADGRINLDVQFTGTLEEFLKTALAKDPEIQKLSPETTAPIRTFAGAGGLPYELVLGDLPIPSSWSDQLQFEIRYHGVNAAADDFQSEFCVWNKATSDVTLELLRSECQLAKRASNYAQLSWLWREANGPPKPLVLRDPNGNRRDEQFQAKLDTVLRSLVDESGGKVDVAKTVKDGGVLPIVVRIQDKEKEDDNGDNGDNGNNNRGNREEETEDEKIRKQWQNLRVSGSLDLYAKVDDEVRHMGEYSVDTTFNDESWREMLAANSLEAATYPRRSAKWREVRGCENVENGALGSFQRGVGSSRTLRDVAHEYFGEKGEEASRYAKACQRLINDGNFPLILVLK